MLIEFKKLGNHWYPVLDHLNPTDLILDPKLEKLINRIDKYKDEKVFISIIQQGDIIIPEGLIQFDEVDILRYLTTNDDFTMNLYISNHKYTISSKLYTLLEHNYNFNFHKEVYRIIL